MHLSIKTFFLAIVAASLLLLSLEGHVNETVMMSAGLSDLVAQSAVIVVVSKANPLNTVEEMTISEKADTPKYKRVTTHLNVHEILLNRPHLALKAASKIDVLCANEPDQFDIFKAYYLEGMSKSPIYQRYESTQTAVSKEKRFIVFLRLVESGDKKTLHFTMDNAYESVKMQPQILALIKAQPK